MRKAPMLATALIAVLALSVGALAYPVVVGTHPLSLFHPGTPATGTHPTTGDDNSTGNETNTNDTGNNQGNQTGDQGNETGDNDANETGDNDTAPILPAPDGNETGNLTSLFGANVTVAHNVTVTTVAMTTYVNGTITVSQNGTELVMVTFALVAHDNGTANATINVTQTAGSETVTVRGFAFYSSMEHAYSVFGVAKATQNGSVLWWKPFAFGSGSFVGSGY